MLCRLKILEIKQGRIKDDVGFIDPYVNNEAVLQLKPDDVEDNLLRALVNLNRKEQILFPYNYSWVLLSYILFCLLDVKCLIDESCVRRRNHYILIIIMPDLGRVEFMDSKHKLRETWEDMGQMLQR